MDFNQDYLKELQCYDVLYENANLEDLAKGYEISKSVQEFDNPEDYLSANDLFLLSQYYAYRNIEESKNIHGDDYEFDIEDLD